MPEQGLSAPAGGTLAAAEGRYRQIVEASPTGIALVGLAPGERGRIHLVNAAMAAFTGRSPDELVGKRIADLLHPDDVEDHLAYLTRAAQDGLAVDGGVLRRFVHTDGTSRYARKSTAVLVPAGSAEPCLLVNVYDVTEHIVAREALTHSALHDPLTGVANRALFGDRLERALTDENREKRGLTLLYVDLDRFKPLNDEHGHLAGDAVLVEVSRRLVGAVRAGDTVARLGGDEFAVICPRLLEESVPLVVSRMHAALAAPFRLPDGTTVTMAASIGGATTIGGLPAQRLLNAADAAMYALKRRR